MIVHTIEIYLLGGPIKRPFLLTYGGDRRANEIAAYYW